VYLVFNSVFTYLVVVYRPIAASAMASNSALCSSFAAGFPLFASTMYSRLGTVGATALLAGLTTLMAPLRYVHLFGDMVSRIILMSMCLLDSYSIDMVCTLDAIPHLLPHNKMLAI
jgi:hypothetical protein